MAVAGRRRALRRAALLLAASLLGGCAALDAPQSRALSAAPPSTLRGAVELTRVPFFAQAQFHCGPASLAVAQAAGVDVTPEALADGVFLPAREGALQVEMLAAARRQGLLAVPLPRRLDALLAELDAGHPVVVLQNLALPIAPRWHYAVAVGYDLAAGEIVLRSGDQPRQRMTLSTFEHTWARGGHWAFVALPPPALPVTADEADAVQAALGFARVAAPADAARAWAGVRARWPDQLVAAIGHGNALFAAGDADAAAQVLAHAAQRHDSAAAWNNLARVHLQRGDRDAAIAAARRAVAAAQREPTWRDAAAQTLRRVEQAP